MKYQEQDVSGVSGSPNLVGRHMAFGWWSLLLFLGLGIALDAMHGLKIGFYLDVSNSTRRLMWSLAHAHGTLLAIFHVVFALTLRTLLPFEKGADRWLQIASPCLIASSILLPGGFFLGGMFIYGGDPGLGVFLVPVGAGLLFLAVFLTARAVAPRRARGAQTRE